MSAHKFLAAVQADTKVKRRLPTEHFIVNGAIIEAWASMKSVKLRDGSAEPPTPGRNGEANLGERRINDTLARLHGLRRFPTWGAISQPDEAKTLVNNGGGAPEYSPRNRLHSVKAADRT